MNKSPQHFERLVLICMDSYDSEKGRILQHFSRSTRFAFLCTAQISKFQRKTRQTFCENERHEFSFFIFRFSNCLVRFSDEFLSFFCQTLMIFLGISQTSSENDRSSESIDISYIISDYLMKITN